MHSLVFFSLLFRFSHLVTVEVLDVLLRVRTQSQWVHEETLGFAVEHQIVLECAEVRAYLSAAEEAFALHLSIDPATSVLILGREI